MFLISRFDSFGKALTKELEPEELEQMFFFVTGGPALTF